MKPKRIGFLGYDGVMALDLAGPMDAFSTAETEGPDGQTCRFYEPVIIGLNKDAFRSESRLVFKPDKTIIPG